MTLSLKKRLLDSTLLEIIRALVNIHAMMGMKKSQEINEAIHATSTVCWAILKKCSAITMIKSRIREGQSFHFSTRLHNYAGYFNIESILTNRQT